MTQEEKEKKLQEMQAASMALRDQRKERSGYSAIISKDQEEARKERSGAKFINQMRQDVYMDSEMRLEDRISRQKHYQDRKEMRKDIN